MQSASALSRRWPCAVGAAGGLVSLVGALSGGGFGWACAANASAVPMKILRRKPDMNLFCSYGSRGILTQKKPAARIGRMRFKGSQSYVSTEDLTLAVNAAITLQRPLLVKGEPGTGKTMLALEVARSLGVPILEWH